MNWHTMATGENLAFTVSDMGNLDKLEQLCALASVLDGMERDLGLNALSDLEKKVLRAAYSVSDRHNHFAPSEVLERLEGERDVSRSSFFRALKALSEAGRIKRMGDEKRAGYQIIGQ